MPTLLKNLMLEELSLVDRPANAQAMVSLFKRDNSEEEVEKMSDEMEAKVKAYMEEKGCGKEEAMKALGYDKETMKSEATEEAPETDLEKAEEDTQEITLETLKADLDKLKEENEFLRKGLIDNGFVIKAEAIEKKAEVEMIEFEGEMVAKADIPAPVLKALEAAKAELEAAAIEKADVALTKQAQELLPHFQLDVAKSLVKAFSEEEEVMTALKAVDKAFSDKMEEFGKTDRTGEFASAKDEMDALVKAYMEENNLKKSEHARAYAAVAKTEKGKALIIKSYKGE